MATFDRNNPFQTQLFERKVMLPYLKDYRNTTMFSKFMGGADAPINMVTENKGDGDRIIFPLRQLEFPRIALGAAQLEGNEQELQYVTDQVEISRVRWATRLTDRQLMMLQTKFQLDSDVRSDLLDKADLYNTKRIVSQFALAFPGAAPIPNFDYSYADLTARMLAANLDQAGAGISRSRILLGNGYYATQATLTAALAVGNLPVNAHKLTVAHIRSLFRLAMTGKSMPITGGAAFTSSESAIRPFKYATKLGFEDKRYVLFVSPEAYNELAQDAAWQAQVNRGTIENENQPSTLYGSMYKGTIEGVMVMVIPEFSNLTITNAAGNTYAYSALIGASAIGFGMGGTPKFTDRTSTDYGLHYGLAHNEISGMKVLKYPSISIGNRSNNTNLVEYGLIHSFTTLA